MQSLSAFTLTNREPQCIPTFSEIKHITHMLSRFSYIIIIAGPVSFWWSFLDERDGGPQDANHLIGLEHLTDIRDCGIWKKGKKASKQPSAYRESRELRADIRGGV